MRSTALLQRLRERGVLRVAASYAVIAWLLLQIADVTFEPLGVPRWVMIALITAAVLGFPVAIMLAWHFELGDRGLERDTAADAAARPVVHGLRRYADVAIIGVLLATVAALLVRQSDLGKPPPPDRPTIAVLPFANLSGDPAQEYFSDGLAQELLDRLGRVPGLAVIGRSSSFSLKGKVSIPSRSPSGSAPPPSSKARCDATGCGSRFPRRCSTAAPAGRSGHKALTAR